MKSFAVLYRNPGHWDIYSEKQRLYRIRGGPSRYILMDEVRLKRENMEFKTLQACMSFICDELMFELIIAEDQKPIIIDSWNI
jgi:hypothetical protein